MTLIIKKKFFDLIKSGEKVIEYRARKKYYERLDHGLDSVKFHYQGRVTMTVEVKKIVRTSEFYEIHLGKLL